MSKFIVRLAELDRLLDAAWLAGNRSEMQSILAEITSLRRSMYGTPQAAR
ncbi:hypothetical protein [Bradyrhizobium neotropicale]|nr:hypothetical protein [Bradyrhizobium neotropicale]